MLRLVGDTTVQGMNKTGHQFRSVLFVSVCAALIVLGLVGSVAGDEGTEFPKYQWLGQYQEPYDGHLRCPPGSEVNYQADYETTKNGSKKYTTSVLCVPEGTAPPFPEFPKYQWVHKGDDPATVLTCPVGKQLRSPAWFSPPAQKLSDGMRQFRTARVCEITPDPVIGVYEAAKTGKLPDDIAGLQQLIVYLVELVNELSKRVDQLSSSQNPPSMPVTPPGVTTTTGVSATIPVAIFEIETIRVLYHESFGGFLLQVELHWRHWEYLRDKTITLNTNGVVWAADFDIWGRPKTSGLVPFCGNVWCYGHMPDTLSVVNFQIWDGSVKVGEGSGQFKVPKLPE